MALIRDDWRNSYKSPTHGIPEVNDWQGGFIVARDRFKRNSTDLIKQYNWAPTWQHVYNSIELLGPPERNFYEVWTEHQCVKLFIDFELSSQPIDQAQIETRIRLIIGRVQVVLYDMYGIEVQEDYFAWLYSHKINPETGAIEKFSAHIVLTRGVYFRNGKHLKDFINFVFPRWLMEEDLARPAAYRRYEGLDFGVYGLSRMLRMPLCSKLGEVRPLEIISGHEFDECLITVCPPGLGHVVDFNPTLQTQA